MKDYPEYVQLVLTKIMVKVDYNVPKKTLYFIFY